MTFKTVAGIERKLGHVRGDVHHQPVPEPAACGCIWIEAGDSEALGAGGGPRPSEMRRLVAAFTAKAIIRRQNVVLGKVVAVLKAIAPDRKRHTLPPVLPPIEADVAAILTEIRQAWATCPDRKPQPNPVNVTAPPEAC